MSADKKEIWRSLYNAAEVGDLATIRAIVPRQIGVDATDEHGNPLLLAVLSALNDKENPPRAEVARVLLELGAAPDCHPESEADSYGPLFFGVLAMNTELIRALLEAGADPNKGRDGGETLLDWADFDYRYETWDFEMPEDSTGLDRSSEDAWLAYLDRIAVKYGKRRPDYLLLLREYGAQCHDELCP